jgi:prepilin-type N-terminal cleavage/methylation domain-containing protein
MLHRRPQRPGFGVADRMKSQAGFTFTELLTAVTIMVMLAAVALPRHAMRNSDHRVMQVRSLEANVRSSAKLSHKVWEATGKPVRMTLDGRQVEIRHGYPTTESISDVVVMSEEFRFSDGYWKHADSKDGQGCAVLYIPPTKADADAVIISYTDGC